MLGDMRMQKNIWTFYSHNMKKKSDFIFYGICLAYGIANFWMKLPFIFSVLALCVAIVISVVSRKYVDKQKS